MTSFFTTFTGGVPIDRHPDHYPAAALADPARQAQPTTPDARVSVSFWSAARRRLDALAVWRNPRR
ncbi:hypothetical protein [Cupriavidus pinatubonensis]|uniref:Uncharacterized protein n=1 Tax=Cupriavidus pinatubonensis TaxID=248026 RepID=A0ABM8Y3P4_9BURK|nr:hypothetical protein [Cupriavidus pinatubonensis]CAG9187399.1 hypothetical protein LMG23994_06844 [Cupriavidus pinatubonensis]